MELCLHGGLTCNVGSAASLEVDAMSHAAIRPWPRVLSVLSVLLVSQHAQPEGLASQQTLLGTQTDDPLQGIVVYQSTGLPVESATVSVVGTDMQALTGPYGAFSFPDAPIGSVTVRVTASGHPALWEEVEVENGSIVFVQFILPSISAVLSELIVGVSGVERESSSLTAADLLAIEVPAARVSSSHVGRTDFDIQLRGPSTSFTANEPMVMIDGVMISRLGRALEALSQIPASNVESIQVLRGPAAMVRYPMAANGVVLVVTRAGGGTR